MPASGQGKGSGSWGSFLKSIASFNGDLSSLTAPAFILSTTSLTEFSAYWAEHPSIFVAPAQEPDPAKRSLLVLKWFLSTLKQQYSSRNDKLGSEKKPLNPFLVSHHPPVTAYCITNAKHGIQLQGYNAQKASFSRTIHIKQVGHALLTLTPPNTPNQPETYLITLPALHIESLITGSPYIELEKYTHIASSSGYVSKIDYSGRGWLSGKKNTFTACMWKEGQGNDKHPLYSVEGQWSENDFSFGMHEGDKPKKGKEVESYRAAPTTPLTVVPIEQQDPFESRRAWRNVAASITKGDMDAVSFHKSKIENAQRELRKKEKEESRDWERKFFKTLPEDDDPTFKKLVKMISGATAWAGVEAEKTAGVWRFDPERAGRARPPYHPEVGERGLGEGGSEPVSKVSTNTSQGGRK
ncbi:hypothetical protein GJ744_003857 [Endocarpon pusillum]|uniref:Oxysterol binding protein n=1 Tax=Endocarpon pusillum TaxID=364733 RepID=A0A8H7AP11_9EURO|nr:hypothetical protein GJ744_003857 [Endocarpon pusillum]